MLTEKLAEFVSRMPKVNLHVHVEGTMQMETLRDIAQKNDYLRELTPRQAEILSRGDFTYTDFANFIDIYSLCANALRSASDYERCVYEYLVGAHQLNARYVEMYVSPYDRLKRGMSFDQIMTGVGAGRKRAENETGILSSVVIDVGRHLLWTTRKDPEHARAECIRLVEVVSQYNESGRDVVGFSLGGKEVGYPVYPFVDAFNLARENGLHVKAHSGESIDCSDVWYVVGLLNVERIGNSVRVVEDEELLAFLHKNRIAIEFCPTGNVLTKAVASLDHHPIRKVLEAGIPVAIGDDDPALFGTDIFQEYKVITEQFGLSTEELENLVITMIDLAWLDQERKATLRKEITAEIGVIRQQLGY